MISISTLLVDISAPVFLNVDLNRNSLLLNRRQTRTATLDGNSALSDLGFTWSDVTLNIDIDNATKEQSEKLEYLIQNYSIVTLSSNIGFFEGAIRGLNVNVNPITFDFLITKKHT